MPQVPDSWCSWHVAEQGCHSLVGTDYPWRFKSLFLLIMFNNFCRWKIKNWLNKLVEGLNFPSKNWRHTKKCVSLSDWPLYSSEGMSMSWSTCSQPQIDGRSVLSKQALAVCLWTGQGSDSREKRWAQEQRFPGWFKAISADVKIEGKSARNPARGVFALHNINQSGT